MLSPYESHRKLEGAGGGRGRNPTRQPGLPPAGGARRQRDVPRSCARGAPYQGPGGQVKANCRRAFLARRGSRVTGRGTRESRHGGTGHAGHSQGQCDEAGNIFLPNQPRQDLVELFAGFHQNHLYLSLVFPDSVGDTICRGGEPRARGRRRTAHHFSRRKSGGACKGSRSSAQRGAKAHVDSRQGCLIPESQRRTGQPTVTFR